MGTAAVAAGRMTADEFFARYARPENADGRWELEQGEVVAMPPPGELHGTVCGWIVYLLWSFAVRRGRGRVTSNDTGLIVERDPDTARGPDIMFFDETVPLDAVSPRFPATLPALVVEVLAPPDSWTNMHRRVLQFLSAGVPLVWVVDSDQQTVTVFRPNEIQKLLDDTDTLTGNGVLPDFTCSVADLFTLPGGRPAAA